MIGLVLSGGKSTRMGTDKGLLEHDGLSWTKLAFDKLRTHVATVYISVSRQQKEKYAQHFEASLLLEDDPSIRIGGPLLGLLSAHKMYNEEDILVLACDMVKMEHDQIVNLVKQYKDMPDMESYLYFNDDGVQPLMAIYTSSLLEKMYQQAVSGELEKFSMKHMVDVSRCFKIAVPPVWSSYFINLNTHEDLRNFTEGQH